MDTHAHHLHHAPGKKFRHYFFEFFMLFLAVFCGFLAENYREKIKDGEKEKQAIEGLVGCLANDTVQLNNIISANTKLEQNLDSFLLLKKKDLSNPDNRVLFYEYGSTGFFQDWYFRKNDAGMEQLKASGMLRLIRRQDIIDSIFGYETKNKISMAQENDCYHFFKESLADFKKITDFSLFKDTAIVHYEITDNFVFMHYSKSELLNVSNDKEKLKEVYNNAAMMTVAIEAYVQFLQDQRNYGKSLITFLKKEYHLN